MNKKYITLDKELEEMLAGIDEKIEEWHQFYKEHTNKYGKNFD